MATYTRKYCPSCGKRYQSYSTYTKHMEVKNGCPFVTCPHCGFVFLDKDIKEPAFHRPPKTNIFQIIVSPLYPWGIGGALLLWASIDLQAVVPFIISMGLFAFCVYIWCFGIANRSKIDSESMEEYEESKDRLSDRDYIILLMNNGYRVPKKFLRENHPDLLNFKKTKGGR